MNLTEDNSTSLVLGSSSLQVFYNIRWTASRALASSVLLAPNSYSPQPTICGHTLQSGQREAHVLGPLCWRRANAATTLLVLAAAAAAAEANMLLLLDTAMAMLCFGTECPGAAALL